MKIFYSKSFNARKNSDCLIIPFYEGKNKAELACDEKPYESIINIPIKAKDFLGREDEVLILYVPKGKEKRLILVGVGNIKKLDMEEIRNYLALAVSLCKEKGIDNVNILIPQIKHIDKKDVIRSVAEGFFLANYSFDKNKSKKSKLISSVTFIGVDDKDKEIVEKANKICEGVYLIRDLVNGNADDITPDALANVAKDLSKKYTSVKATVWKKDRIQKEKMDLLLSVNRGSALEPAFIQLKYEGNKKSKDHTVLIGKGITYDSGGLSLKPSTSMDTMRTDMAGAATVLGVMKIVASLGLKVNLTVLVPSTENMIGPDSYKPGDTYQSYSGKTVEVINTDAEGRLILADAISYAVKNLNPTRIIDMATLTGAILVALGDEISGMFTNSEEIAQRLEDASYATGEWVCRMPLFEKYKEMLKSEIADIKNVGGRDAGSITAALFLETFVKDVPWVHLDIAGTSYFKKKKGYHLAFGTGMGARLIVEFLEKL